MTITKSKNLEYQQYKLWRKIRSHLLSPMKMRINVVMGEWELKIVNPMSF